MSTPTLDQLAARLKAIKATSLSHTGYRSTTPKYATEGDLLTGAGAGLHGARWNPRGIPAIYASFTPETAIEESLAHFRYYRIPVHKAMPRVFVAVQVKLSRVLDLTVGENRRRLRISESRLLECDWRKEMAAGREALTQLIGRAAKSTGFEAMVVRSVADPDGQNVVVFPDNLRESSSVQVLDAGKLNP